MTRPVVDVWLVIVVAILLATIIDGSVTIWNFSRRRRRDRTKKTRRDRHA